MSPRKLTEEQELEVIKLYEQGLTTAKISEFFGVAGSTIKNTLKKNNITSRSLSDYLRKFSPEQELEIIGLYKNGKSMTVIAKHFKCSLAAIDRIFKAHNIQKTAPGIYGRKLSPAQEQEVIKLYSKGKTIKLIAKRYDVNIVTISKILKRNNIEIRTIFKRKIFPDQEKEIIQLYQKAWPIEEISAKVQIARSTVIRVLNDNDIYEPVRNKKRPNPPLIPEKQHTRIILLYQQGLSVTKLAEEYGVVPGTIKRVLDLNNIKIRQPEYYNKKLSDKDAVKIIQLYKKGLPVSQVAKKFKVKSGAITRILKKNQVELRPQGYYQKKLNDNDEAEIIRLYRQGLTKAKIAEQFNISPPAVNQALKLNNIESRKVSHQIKVTEAIEKEIIRLYKGTGSIHKVGKLLGLSPSTVSIKLHKHNLLKKL
jgi:DNA-binding NarL/FixJ family response regulator